MTKSESILNPRLRFTEYAGKILVEQENNIQLCAIIYIYYDYLISEGLLQIVT